MCARVSVLKCARTLKRSWRTTPQTAGMAMVMTMTMTVSSTTSLTPTQTTVWRLKIWIVQSRLLAFQNKPMKEWSRIWTKVRNGSDLTKKERTLNSLLLLTVRILLESKYQQVKLWYRTITLPWIKKTRAATPRRVVTPVFVKDSQISSSLTRIRPTWLKEVRAKSWPNRLHLKSQRLIKPTELINHRTR